MNINSDELKYRYNSEDIQLHLKLLEYVLGLHDPQLTKFYEDLKITSQQANKILISIEDRINCFKNPIEEKRTAEELYKFYFNRCIFNVPDILTSCPGPRGDTYLSLFPKHKKDRDIYWKAINKIVDIHSQW